MKTTLVLLLVLVMSVAVQANVYTYTPNPDNLYNLSHGYAFTWGFDLPMNEEITGAKLTFTNIRDWIVEDGDSLYIHLLDDAPVGTSYISDYWDGAVDYFAGQGTLIDVWHDPAGGDPGIDLVYDFTADQLAALNAYAADGTGGFGFDPDCHYWNDGVSFEVTTAVPEPATMILFGMGLAGMGLRRRKKRK